MSTLLDELVERLTSPHSGGLEQLYSRAILLFDFQVQLLFPGRLFGNKGPRLARVAPLIAALKLLGEAESNLNSKLERAARLADLAAEPLFAALFNNEVLPRGGLSKLCDLPSSRWLDKRVGKRLAEAEHVADLIDISYSFDREAISTRHKGGITTALDIHEDSPEYKHSPKKSTMKKLWRRYKETSAFIYLIKCQGFELQPPQVKKRKFADFLLRQASDTDYIVEFFSAYVALTDVLFTRGYTDLPVIRFKSNRPAPSLPRKPLSDESLSLLRYKS